MNFFEAQTASETVEFHSLPEQGESIAKEHDFLSFLSLFVLVVRDMSTDLFLASVLLGPSINIQDPVGRGKFFSITLIEKEEISASFPIPAKDLSPLPNIVAIKAPLLEGDANSPSNRKIFRSMATELQILRDSDIRSHNNVITLLGVCWHLSQDKQLLPAFVMEASEIGNLRVFLNTRSLSLLEQVRCCIDLSSGIQAIHHKGVIHGDIKPENLLVFKDINGGFTIKVCDFGASMLVSNASPTCRLVGGTRIWQAPNVRQSEGTEALMEADMYSLGLVMWYIFNPAVAIAVLDCDPISLDLTKASGELLDTVIETLEFAITDESLTISEEQLQLQQCLFTTTLITDGSERWDVDAILNCLSELKETIITNEYVMFNNLNIGNNDLPESLRSAQIDEQLRDVSVKGKEPANLIHAGTGTLISYQQSEIDSDGYIKDGMDRDNILNLTRLAATMKLLPGAVLDEIQTQLELVANNCQENMARRAKSAYQYAMCALQRLKLSYTSYRDVQTSLTMIQQAASFGNQEAQYVVNILHETFDRIAPFSPEIEIPWLKSGTILGSMTARNRLSILNQDEHEKAIKTLRNDYAGIGVKHNIDEGKVEDILIMHECGVSRRNPRMLQLLSMMGNITDYPKFLSFGYYDVNEVDAWGETALLVACRGGHAAIAKLLLESGADPNIASNENLTPLHFLGAFDNHEIPAIGKLLLQSNAFLEARSTAGTGFNSRIDCQFGVVEGTPLLWAVAARSLVATKLLVEFGADPFDTEGVSLPVSSTWHGRVHFSPVDFAASMHQHEFLQVMLQRIHENSAEDCAMLLNNNFRIVAPYPNLSALPMFWAVDYSHTNLLVRILLHGKNHKAACKKTIKTLTVHGANTSVVDNQGRSALNISCLQGHLFLTTYLLQCHDDQSNYETENLRQILFNSTRIDDLATFDMLLRHIEKKNIQLNDIAVQENFARTAEATNNLQFINYYLEHHKWTLIQNRDDGDAFERAILNGHFEPAQMVFSKGRVDIMKRLLYPNGDFTTMFGRLLIRAKKFKNGVDKVEQFLSITSAPDELFNSVLKTEEEELTALHLVCLYANYNKSLAASGPIVDLVLQSYNSKNHLNAQVTGGKHAGWTALHFAVNGGNVPAVDRLLQAGINPNILSDQGETALDRTKSRWRNQTRFLEDIPLEERSAWTERHEKITTQLSDLLSQAGAVCKRYFAMVKKVDKDNIMIEIFSSQAQDIVSIDNEGVDEMELMMPGFRKIITELKIDHMFLLGTSDQTLDAECEVQSQKSMQQTSGQTPAIPARWGTESCHNSRILTTRSVPITTHSYSQAGSSNSSDKPPFSVEVISSALSRNKTAKLAMDHDITDLCDWFREHEGR